MIQFHTTKASRSIIQKAWSILSTICLSLMLLKLCFSLSSIFLNCFSLLWLSIIVWKFGHGVACGDLVVTGLSDSWSGLLDRLSLLSFFHTLSFPKALATDPETQWNAEATLWHLPAPFKIMAFGDTSHIPVFLWLAFTIIRLYQLACMLCTECV